MASVKIFSLAVKTLAKPIASAIKSQATQHESFRNICISLAQRMHRTESRMRMGLLNEEAKNIRPLNDAKAVQNGANTLAEGFLFVVGVSLVLAETYRSTRKNNERRDMVAERLDKLEADIEGLKDKVDKAVEIHDLQKRSEGLEKALSTVVNSGVRTGWLQLGHEDSEVLRLVGNLPGQPFALRKENGNDNTESSEIEDAGDESGVVASN